MRRWFARAFDVQLTAFPIVVALSVLIPFRPHSAANVKTELEGYGYLLGLLSLPIWFLVESWMIATFKTTPGKWLWGISIEGRDGREVPFSRAISRSLSVWGSGMYLGIPGFILLAGLINYFRLKRDKVAYWDKKGNTRCVHREITFFKGMMIVLGVVAFLVLRNLDKLR